MRLKLAVAPCGYSFGAMMLALAFTSTAHAQAAVPPSTPKATVSAAATTVPANADWTEPFPPFRIAGNLYYVGSKGLANYLIVTPQGNILINSDTEANVPMIKASIEKLGFKFGDTKILLISHAHWDHDAGSALVKQETGAKYMVMDADVPVVESGGKEDFSMAARRRRTTRRRRWIACCTTATKCGSAAHAGRASHARATRRAARPGR